MNINELHFDNKNANRHTLKGLKLLEKSLQTLGAGRSILIDKDNNIIAGNGVIEVAGQIGLEKIKIVETDGNEIIAVKRKDVSIDSKKGRELAIADNQTAKVGIDFDFDVINELSEEYNINLGNEWELAIPDLEHINISDITKEVYSKKIDAPLYQPKDDKPEIITLFDMSKTLQLLDEIQKSEIEPKEKEFLNYAASRHIVFNYSAIADYYAHSGKEMQGLMEKSGLVIIDFHNAIEYGFVKMSNENAVLC